MLQNYLCILCCNNIIIFEIFSFYNFSADSGYNAAVINTNVMVESSGLVNWLSHGIYKSSCKVNVEYFPFDVQVCEMKWASWTYDADGVRFKVYFSRPLFFQFLFIIIIV